VTHHTTTQQEIIDIKCVFQSYYMKKYILIHFEIQKKLIVVGLFLLLAGFRGPQANFTGRSLTTAPRRDWQLEGYGTARNVHLKNLGKSNGSSHLCG
jgi:hypothetical protein